MLSYTGRTFQDKLTSLRETLKQKKAAGMVVNMLDEVAWLFNLRGSDIDYNPGMQRFARFIAVSEPSRSLLRVRGCDARRGRPIHQREATRRCS